MSAPQGPSRRDIAKFVADSDPDDGIDPRRPPKRPKGLRGLVKPASQPSRKALQLCGQVARTLNEALADARDEWLQALLVVRVQPAPDIARMMVTVAAAGPPASEAPPEAILAHLHAASGRLRAEVAAAINRRAAPNLSFQVEVAETAT